MPQELFAVMPPMVAREAVETSTGNHRPCGLSLRLRSSSTMPGSTTQRRPADVEIEQLVQVLRAVDDQRVVDGLPGLRGAAAARQHAHALLARERERALGLRDGARHAPRRAASSGSARRRWHSARG